MVNLFSTSLIIILVTSTLAGCSGVYSGARKDPATILARVEQDIIGAREARLAKDSYLHTKRDRATRPIGVVKIPRSAKWLRTPVEARYSGVPAQDAIRVVLDGRPHRYDIAEIDGAANFGVKRPSNLNDTQQVTLATGEKVTLPSSRKKQSQPLPMTRLVTSMPGVTTVKQHLDAICSQSGLSYSIESGVVVFSNFVVEIVPLRAASIGAEQKFLFSNNQADALGASQVLGQTIYDEVVSSLTKIVSSPHSFSVDKSANLVTLRATSEVMRQAKRYLNSVNYASARRVALRLDIYDVNLTALGKRSFDFSVSNVISDYASLNGLVADIAINGQQQVNTGAAPLAVSFGVNKAGARLDGASGLIRLLRSKGAITGRISKEFVVSNNEQVDEIRTRNTPYVSRVSVEEQFQGGTQSNTPNIDTKDANTGVAIQIYPTISGNNVYVNMTLEESRLIRFDEYSFGGEGGVGLIAGRLPVTDKFQSRFKFGMHDGETLAIAGSITAQREHEIANAGIPILNDSVDKNEIRSQSLIFVSANILD